MSQVRERPFKQGRLIRILSENKSCKDINRIQQRALLLLFLPLISFQKLLGHNWEKSKAYNLGDKWNI